MKIRKRFKIEDFKLGCIFFVPFLNSDKGVFGYIKYNSQTRTNPRSLEMPLADIYNRVCQFDEWSEEIKHGGIKIYDHIFSPGYFYKTRYNTKPMLLTDQYTDIIHPVKYGFFKTGSEKYWYDADAENIAYPDDDEQYRWLRMAFPPYDQQYIEAIFNGENIQYGDPVPGVDYDE